MRRTALFLIVSIVLSSAVCHGVIIGFFPGLDELIGRADAIVILRIDRSFSEGMLMSPTLYGTYDCYIYQTLKGEIPANRRIRLRLMDARTSFISQFALMSTHLVFLIKKQTPNEQTDYDSLNIEGADVLISPFGNEEMPEGKTVKEKIQALLTRTLEYNKKEYEKERMFLRKMRDESKPVPAKPSP